QHVGRCGARVVGGAAEPGHLRGPHHRLLDLRTARSVRDLAEDPELLEWVAIHVLVERPRAVRPNKRPSDQLSRSEMRCLRQGLIEKEEDERSNGASSWRCLRCSLWWRPLAVVTVGRARPPPPMSR